MKEDKREKAFLIAICLAHAAVCATALFFPEFLFAVMFVALGLILIIELI
jgi:diacylglycerol kinase